MMQRENPLASTRLTSRDLFALAILRSAAFSCDGASIAIGISRIADEHERLEIEISTREGRRKLAIPYPGQASLPAWSPDGQRIAFSADGRLRIFDLTATALSDPLTSATSTLIGAPAWSPDGRALALCLSEDRGSPERAIRRYHYKADGLGRIEGLRRTIHIIDPDGGALLRRFDFAEFLTDPRWSPDGEQLLFTASEMPVTLRESDQQLLIWDKRTDTRTCLCDKGWYIQTARWTSDGRSVVIAGSHRSGQAIPNISIWSIDVATGTTRSATEQLVCNVGSRILSDLPCREVTAGVQILAWSPDHMIATLQRRGAAEVWKVGLEDQAESCLLSGEDGASHLLLDVHPDSHSALIAVASARLPPELWMLDLRSLERNPITDLNSAAIAAWPEVEVVSLGCTSEDGREIDCWFFGPRERAGSIPTVLYIHPGPFVAAGHGFRFDFHLLASHGIGVVFHNFRGSAGYGRAFTQAIVGDWGARGFSDHIAAIESAVAQGCADPARLGVWGQSHGGFATTWVVGHTHIFAAAIAEASFTDLASLYYTTDLPEAFSGDLGGRPHEIPDVYRSRSPITHAHRCTTPTMMLHGELDQRCTIDQAERFYRALRDADCPSELVIIPGAAHLSDSIGSIEARQLQNESLVRWFTGYLLADTPGRSAALGGHDVEL